MKKTICVYIEVEQDRLLKLIAEASDGKPKVAGLIRQAIDEFIAKRREKKEIQEYIRRAESEQNKAKIVRIHPNRARE